MRQHHPFPKKTKNEQNMRHESIIVVYDSCQAIAEEIADKLGAETVSVQSMNSRYIGNCQSFVLAIEFQADGQLTPHWQYVCQTFSSANLGGKNLAVFVALGNSHEHGAATEAFCTILKKSGGHIVGELSYVGSPLWNINNWVCAVSPNL